LSLLNPLVREDGLEFSELRPFDHKVKLLIDGFKSAGDATAVSVYFRNLQNGPLFVLDTDGKFSPASLLKVPLMMAVLKEAERDPSLLSRKLRNDLPSMVRSDFASHSLKRGELYSVDELLQAMIASSDNDAVVMLRTVVGDEPLNAVFRDFGLVIPEVRAFDDNMTVKEYATFFRVLYNASFLSKAMSQKALQYLAASDFKQGLVAGVPAGTIVAHKFGERTFADTVTRQLHDCGIVYYPSNPYIVCVMTRGSDFTKLSDIIRDISALIHAEVEAHRMP